MNLQKYNLQLDNLEFKKTRILQEITNIATQLPSTSTDSIDSNDSTNNIITQLTELCATIQCATDELQHLKHTLTTTITHDIHTPHQSIINAEYIIYLEEYTRIQQQYTQLNNTITDFVVYTTDAVFNIRTDIQQYRDILQEHDMNINSCKKTEQYNRQLILNTLATQRQHKKQHQLQQQQLALDICDSNGEHTQRRTRKLHEYYTALNCASSASSASCSTADTTVSTHYTDLIHSKNIIAHSLATVQSQYTTLEHQCDITTDTIFIPQYRQLTSDLVNCTERMQIVIARCNANYNTAVTAMRTNTLQIQQRIKNVNAVIYESQLKHDELEAKYKCELRISAKRTQLQKLQRELTNITTNIELLRISLLA
jgi:hypothetical protein